MAVERKWKKESDNEYDALVTSLKDRSIGQRKTFKYYFSQETLRFYNAATPKEREYGWLKYTPPAPWEVE